jgi:hypothetical protein
VTNLAISGGTFASVISEEGAGLGGGHATGGETGVETIEIAGGLLFLTGMNGAALGTGLVYDTGTSRIEQIDISDGEITATSSAAAAIGTGQVQLPHAAASSRIESVTIRGGVVNCWPSSAVGIGAADTEEGGSSQLAELTIDGGKVSIVAETAAIGAAGRGVVEQIQLDGIVVLNCTVRQGACFTTGVVHFKGSLTASVDAAKFIDAPAEFLSGPRLFVQFRGSKRAEKVMFGELPALQIAWIAGLQDREYALSLWANGRLLEQREFDAREAHGFMAALPIAGGYKVSFVDNEETPGYLRHGFGNVFTVGSELSYVDEAIAHYAGAGQGECSSAGTSAAIALGIILLIVLGAVAAAVYFLKIGRGAKSGKQYENVSDGSLVAGGAYL